MTQALELGQRPGTTGRQIGMLALRHAACRTDQVRQAGLAASDPGVVHAVASADEDACPVVDEGRTGCCGPVGMQHGERRGVTHDPPQPLQGAGEKPRGFIAIIDWGLARLRGNGVIMRRDGLRDAVSALLHGAEAAWHLEHRGTKTLDDVSTCPVGPGTFPDEGGQPRVRAGRMLGGDLGVVQSTTDRTPPLVQHQVSHVYRDRRQLEHVVRLGGCPNRTRGVPHAHRSGWSTCTAVGGKRAWRCPAWPGFPPAVRGVAGAERCRGFVEGGSDDGGRWEVGECWWRRASSVSTRAWSGVRSACIVRRDAWTAGGVCSQSCGGKGNGPATVASAGG